MSVETLVPVLGLFTLLAVLAISVYRLIRIWAKQKHPESAR